MAEYGSIPFPQPLISSSLIWKPYAVPPGMIAAATSLVLLARNGRLELLRDVLGEVWIPEAVAHELRKPGVAALEKAMREWIQMVPVRYWELIAALPRQLDLGTAE